MLSYENIVVVSAIIVVLMSILIFTPVGEARKGLKPALKRGSGVKRRRRWEKQHLGIFLVFFSIGGGKNNN